MFKVYFNLSIIYGSKVHRIFLHPISESDTVISAIDKYLLDKFKIDTEWCRVTFGSFLCSPGEIVFNYVGFLPDRLSYLVDESFVDLEE